jgi:excisionase family DNA binding protein
MLNTHDFLLTLRQVGQTLGLGHTKVSQLISDGSLQSLKIGRARRVRRSDLDRFLEGRSRASSEVFRCKG